MVEANKKIKHFVLVRFFSRQRPNYPHDVLNVDFLSKQLPLANNVLRTMENQTNKNFELVFIMNPKCFDDPKYEFIFDTLKNSAKLPITFIKRGETVSLVRAAYNNYDFVIQSRMDFDDFVYKDAVADTQNKIEECVDMLCYGYCKGYMYFDEKLYNYSYLSKGRGHLGIFQSLIVKSEFAKSLPFTGIYSFPHHKIKLRLKNSLEKAGLAFSERMFQQNVSVKAYIYFRHEFSTDALAFKRDALTVIKKKKLPLAEDITKKQAEEKFNFHYALSSIK